MGWDEVERETTLLAKKIDYSPDIIVAVARGGFVPGRLLAKSLGVKKMFGLTVTKSGDSRKIESQIDKESIAGKEVLLVEDMIESGRSLIAAKKYLEDLGASVHTTALYSMPDSEISLDYCLKSRRDIPEFPWD